MSYTIRLHGDPLERANADFIESRLPNYGALWNEFIGNDGHAQLPGQSELEPEVARLRMHLSLYSYTALEAILGARRLAVQAEAMLIPEGAEPAAIDIYIDSSNLLIAFFAQIGRVRDALAHLGNEWSDDEIWLPVDDYYKQRSNILHEAKVPSAIVDGVLHVAVPGGINPTAGEWSKEKTWDDVENLRSDSLPRLFDRILDEVVRRLDAGLARLRSQHLYKGLSSVRTVMSRQSVFHQGSSHVTATLPLTMSGDIYNLPPTGRDK